MKFQQYSSSAEQKSIYNGTITLQGSDIEYLPLADSEYVVYDYTTYYATENGNNYNAGTTIKLQIGDSTSSYGDVVASNTNYTIGQGATYHETSTARKHFINSHSSIVFYIPISSWPKDSDNRLKKQTLLLRATTYGPNMTMFHGTTTDSTSGANDTLTLHYDPFLSVYCL